jgi:hypothetical protein
MGLLDEATLKKLLQVLETEGSALQQCSRSKNMLKAVQKALPDNIPHEQVVDEKKEE